MSNSEIPKTSLLELDDETCNALWKGQRLDLSCESYRVLRQLASNPGKIYTPSEIVEEAKIWSDAGHTEVMRQFQMIKQAFWKIELGDYPIKVIWKQGYTWDETPPTRSILARLFERKRT